MASIIDKKTIDAWKLFCDQVQASTAVNFNESKADQAARIFLAKKDYNFFVKTYFPIYADADCADFHIDLAYQVVKKKRPADDPNVIAVAEWPREHAKSVHCDVLIPMWMLANDELNGMILMGKSENDACTLLGDIQAQLQHNELFIHDFGQQFQFGSWEEGDFTTKGGIRFLAVGRDQSPRGARKGEKRPNYAVCDDIDDDEIVHNQKRVKKIVERILGALFFALDTRGGTLVVAGNRIHQASILAHIVGDTKPNAPKREGIYHSKIFAIDPKTGKPAWHQRYTLAQIESKIKKAGTAIGRKELFHENHVEGTIFTDKLIHWRKMLPWSAYEIVIGYFDPSFENNPTSDFKAVRVWGLYIKSNGEYEKHCFKAFVRRTTPDDCFSFMSKFEDKHPGSGVVWKMERQFTNKTFKEALIRHNIKRANERRPKLYIALDDRDKEKKYNRIVKMEMDYQDAIVYYNIDEMHNPDMIEGNNQLKGIEPGYKSPDDSPDADEGAWYFLDQHLPSSYFPPVIQPRKRGGW